MIWPGACRSGQSDRIRPARVGFLQNSTIRAMSGEISRGYRAEDGWFFGVTGQRWPDFIATAVVGHVTSSVVGDPVMG